MKYHPIISLLILALTSTLTHANTPADSIPPSGTYRYDVAFAEWNGVSMGEKVTVIIKGDSIKVIYEGDGQLTNTVAGEVMEDGVLRRHKSGVWIISSKEDDVEIEEVGGCTGGPTVIDFEEKKYWLC
ncbi:flagella basal body P-ring formation protein FlgA [bacterium]|nr:flagella basal body P-ring formation protein FlgA [bacterium]